MDTSSFELLETKIQQILSEMKDLRADSAVDGSVVLSESQVDRISERLTQISEWIDDVRQQK